MGISTNRYRREVNIEPILLLYKHYIEKSQIQILWWLWKSWWWNLPLLIKLLKLKGYLKSVEDAKYITFYAWR